MSDLQTGVKAELALTPEDSAIRGGKAGLRFVAEPLFCASLGCVEGWGSELLKLLQCVTSPCWLAFFLAKSNPKLLFGLLVFIELR